WLGRDSMGHLGSVWGVGITPRSVKGFRLSNSFAVGRHHANLAGGAGLGARVAHAGAVEIGPGLLAAGEAGLHVEAVAFAGGRLGHAMTRRSRHLAEARRQHKRASDQRGCSYDAVNLEHFNHPVPASRSRR